MAISTSNGGIADLTDETYWLNSGLRSIGRLFLLSQLHERPLHGYALKQAIQECCAGACCPTDAMVYPAIKELLDDGYIECEEEAGERRPRKVCRLTPRGRAAYAAAARAWANLLPGIQQAVERAPRQAARSKTVKGLEVLAR